MSEKDNGGQAFPFNGTDWATEGMSLRDYFAAKALPSVLADAVPESGASMDDYFSHVAEICYRIAHAMLEARKK